MIIPKNNKNNMFSFYSFQQFIFLFIFYSYFYIFLISSSSPFKENTAFSKMQCLMTGHYTPNKKWTNEAWGLAPLKDGDRFVSSSDDGTLRMFSSKERKQIQMIRTNLGI